MPKFLSSVCEVQKAVTALRNSPDSEYFARVDSASDIGKAIRSRRELVEATVEQVAEMVGLRPNTVREIENGNSYCAFGWILLVANVLGVDLFSSVRVFNHENL